MRTASPKTLAALIAALVVCSQADPAITLHSQGSDLPVLDRGQQVERTLEPGQKNSYWIRVDAGQFLQVVVEQRGVDVVVTLYGLDGQAIYAANCPCGAIGPETISYIAPVSGSYRLEIAPAPKATAGRYEARIAALRPAVEADVRVIAAERSYAEAEQLRLLGTGTSLQRSAILYESAAEHSRAAGDRRGEADALSHAGYVFKVLGDTVRARDYYQRALPMWEDLGDPLEQASLLNNLGVLYSSMGEAQKALDCYRRSLPLWEAAGDLGGRAITLNGIGAESFSLGDYQTALQYFGESLKVRRQVRDQRGEGNTLQNLGKVYAALGDKQKAIELLNQALPLRTAAGDRRGQADTLTNLGAVYSSMRDAPKALELFAQALPLRTVTGDVSGEAQTLHSMGAAFALMGDAQQALDHYRRALALNRSLQQRRNVADTLLGIAHVERDMGELARARADCEEALDISEALRVEVASPDLRTSFQASVEDRYQFYIDLLMRMHQQHPDPRLVATALEAVERSRARSLLELLVEARADIRQGVDPDLLSDERRLEEKLSARAAAQTTLMSGARTEAQAAAASKEVEDLTAQYRDLRARIRATSPRYAALTQVHPIPAADIQALMDSSGSVLLEFALGDEASYVFAVTPTSIASFALPRRDVVEASARRVYEGWSANRGGREEPQTAREVAALSGMLLGPLSDLIGTNRRLVIVADGALQYLPFNALSIPAPKGTHLPRALLIAEHEIVNLPSASALALLRSESRRRPATLKRVAVLADPVFDPADPRVTSRGAAGHRLPAGLATASARQAGAAGEAERAARDVGLMSFDRLFSSRREAEAIAALTRDVGLKALDFDASRETAMRPDLAEFSILHFATHGLLDSRHPELSGLVFSLVDKDGRSRNGFLRAHEIYNLKLNADLVVLSACQTALGTEVRGEGLIGLTQGFMYAGVPRVVASLWRVPDRATADLMKQFYRAMLVDGLEPAAALRSAQNAIRQTRQWSAPYYWAAFTLQGEWK